MQGATARQITDLMAARGAGGDDRRIRLGSDFRKQVQVGNLGTQIEMLFFVAERSSHAAAAGVENGNVRRVEQAQSRRGAGHAAQRLLMAMTVQQVLPGLGGPAE